MNNSNSFKFYLLTILSFISDLVLMSLYGQVFTITTRQIYYLDCFQNVKLIRRLFILSALLIQSFIFGLKLSIEFILICLINIIAMVVTPSINISYLTAYFIIWVLSLLSIGILSIPWTILSLTVNIILTYVIIKNFKVT